MSDDINKQTRAVVKRWLDETDWDQEMLIDKIIEVMDETYQQTVDFYQFRQKDMILKRVMKDPAP